MSSTYEIFQTSFAVVVGVSAGVFCGFVIPAAVYVSVIAAYRQMRRIRLRRISARNERLSGE